MTSLKKIQRNCHMRIRVEAKELSLNAYATGEGVDENSATLQAEANAYAKVNELARQRYGTYTEIRHLFSS